MRFTTQVHITLSAKTQRAMDRDIGQLMKLLDAMREDKKQVHGSMVMIDNEQPFRAASDNNPILTVTHQSGVIASGLL